MTILNEIFILTVIIVFIVDVSGLTPHIKQTIKKILNTDKEIKDKPFFCSLCMTHHIGVLYLLIAGHFTLFNWLFVCLFAFLTPIIKEVFYLLNALMLTIIDYLYFIMRK